MTIKRLLAAVAIGVTAVLAVPSMASATYTITKGKAQRDARDAADKLPTTA